VKKRIHDLWRRYWRGGKKKEKRKEKGIPRFLFGGFWFSKEGGGGREGIAGWLTEGEVGKNAGSGGKRVAHSIGTRLMNEKTKCRGETEEG